MNPADVAIEATPEKGVTIMSPEEYAAAMKMRPLTVKKMLRKSGNTKYRFDERDVDRRFGQKKIRLRVTQPNASGFARPRVVLREAT